MGNQSVKASANAPSVSPKELAIIEKTVQKSNDIKQSDVQKLWSDFLTDSLMQSYIQFIFLKKFKSTSAISLKSYTVLLNELGRGTTDHQAAALYLVLKSNETVTVENLKQYLAEVFLSCFKILEKKQNKSYLMWRNASSESFDSDLSCFVNFLCQDLEKGDNLLTEDSIFNWFARCQTVHLLQSFVILHLYGLYQSQESSGQMPPLLPNLKHPPSSNVVSSLLSLPGILFINELLPAEFQKDWRLLFSSNLHGESFSMMLKSIVDQGPTIVIVKDTDGYVFGGFAADNWRLGPKFYGDSSCFLFSLSPKFSICHATGYNSHYMYINSHQTTLPNGLGMGGQFDYWGLWIDSEFGIGTCSNSCSTYDNYTCLSKDKNFRIAHLEVWGVGIPPPTAAEKGEREVGKSILNKDPTASAILEMAGKTRHSAGLPNEPDNKDTNSLLGRLDAAKKKSHDSKPPK